MHTLKTRSRPPPPIPDPQVEDVLNVIEKERPNGIIVQFGGQTPLKLSTALEHALKENPVPTADGEWGWALAVFGCLAVRVR